MTVAPKTALCFLMIWALGCSGHAESVDQSDRDGRRPRRVTASDGSVPPEKARVGEPGSKTKAATIPALPEEEEQALKAMGYFDRAPTDNPQDRNITKKTEVAFDGLNLYSSRHRAKALLIDMDGRVRHTWCAETKRPPWMHAELQPNGDLLVISKWNYLARIDWDSNVRWKRPLETHHDFAQDPKGRIFALTYRIKKYIHDKARIPILDDNIAVLSPDGKILKTQPLFPLLRQFVPQWRLSTIRKRFLGGASVRDLIQENAPSDTTHANSIQVIEAPIGQMAPAGSILLSLREINRIVLLDPDMTRVLWSWGRGELQEQHHATLQDNGNIMVFDNGIHRKQSRIIEVNPLTGEVAWSYTAPDFYTRLRGAAQKLPNGNVLATESNEGHAFEVTPDGKVVWEFWNPDIIGPEEKMRAVIYRMTRYGPDFLKRALPNSAAAECKEE